MADHLIPIPSPGQPLSFGRPGDPLVILVHDWYGRLPGLVALGEGLVREGFRVVIPDLYSGVATLDDAEAEGLMTSLSVGVALAELDDVIATARAEGSSRVGVVGFSMGGWIALLHAQGGSEDAVVAYYSTLAPRDHGVIPSPVLLQFAEFDEWEADETPESFIDRLREHGTPVTEYRYVDTVHSFANADIQGKFAPRSAELAFARTANFLVKHLLD
ncbi:dienelactone hydrolase family protein [Galbitalea soli]|uniref:Alpha/beta fold hydrolase n=1 Tax=Galbitalea soli TaxID=1268042 RepID=A0A7C9PNQ8_9MICO|nr:alpha/beta fold hydrolase [Galbitalea soli]NEM91805.1 alpha/beta fold hydrolase [Galbitalea soli]NYJ29362.1 carboxymethylenebutenolidase [Galbitalea soli]